jgi:fluoroacetyl-CoA thioesterase
MLYQAENEALNAIRAYLDPGESAIGTAVNVRHLAATPVGRLDYCGSRGDQSRRAAKSRSPSEQLMPRRSGTARISRVVIDVAKFARRLE